MTGWLQAWGAPLTNPGAPMSWMGQMGHGSGDHCADGHVDEHCPRPRPTAMADTTGPAGTLATAHRPRPPRRR